MPSRLLDALAERPLLLDGGMGTRLMSLGLDLVDDDPALWNLSHPETVSGIHSRDIAAGSDVLLTNTFGANSTWLERFGRAGEMAAINSRAAALARGAAGTARFVLGSIGPTAGTVEVYRAQAQVLAEAGVDAILLETHTDAQARIALEALRPALELPIFVSLSWFATPIGEAARKLVGAGADVLGINCVRPSLAIDRLAELRGACSIPLVCKPYATHPDEPSVPPAEFAEGLDAWLGLGVRLVGGCCGATEAHIAALRTALDSGETAGMMARPLRLHPRRG